MTYAWFSLLKLAQDYDNINYVMVSVLASNAVDRGFEPWWGQTKDYKIRICCFSAKHAALRRKSKYKDWWLGIRIMCQSGATCLSADCCFSELALWISNYICKLVGLVLRGPHHHLIENWLVLAVILPKHLLCWH